MNYSTRHRKKSPATERGSSFQGHSRLADIVSGPWALQPETLRELRGIYETHLRGDKIDIGAVEARFGRPLANEQRSYEVVSGVAVQPIAGVLAPKMNLFMQISGGASTQMLARSIADAVDDPGVRSILLQIDSPGGSVLGTPELAEAIRAAAGQKPVIAITDGVMASAAYWVGSAANAIYATGPTVMVGSIGVVATHVDQSASDAKAGVKRTEIVAGKYKRIASDTAPLSDEGAATMQAQVDAIYAVFLDTVAANRGTDVDTVLEHMADGRVFVGQQAIDAGLVDGVSTVDALIAQMAANPDAFATRRKAKVKALTTGTSKPTAAGVARVATTTNRPTGDHPMSEETETAPAVITRASLERDNPAVAADLIAAGAQQERDRIKGVREQLIPGHEALIDTLAMDGHTTPAEAAMAINRAERDSRAAAVARHEADAPPAVRGGVAQVEHATKSKSDQVEEAKTYAAANGTTFVDAMKKLGFAS